MFLNKYQYENLSLVSTIVKFYKKLRHFDKSIQTPKNPIVIEIFKNVKKKKEMPFLPLMHTFQPLKKFISVILYVSEIQMISLIS